MDDRQLLGARLKEIRNSRGLSQEELAEKIGGSWRYLSSVERGKENPTLALFMRLKKALKVEIVDFFNYPWLAMRERELRKKMHAMAEEVPAERLLEMFALMKAREL